MSSESSPSFFYPFRVENIPANFAYNNGIASENDALGLDHHGIAVVGLESEGSVDMLTLEAEDRLGVAMLTVGLLMICNAKNCYLTI